MKNIQITTLVKLNDRILNDRAKTTVSFRFECDQEMYVYDRWCSRNINTTTQFFKFGFTETGKIQSINIMEI